MSELKIHSDQAWNIAVNWADLLASDTRTLAAAIDAALAAARQTALEEAATVATVWAHRTATEANQLRKLRDYARAKQLISEAEGAQRIANAIRALKEKAG